MIVTVRGLVENTSPISLSYLKVKALLFNNVNLLCLSSYLEPDNILSVDFCEVVVDQNTVTSRRTVFDDLSDFAISESEPNVVGAILLHCNSPLERSEE